MSRAISLVEVLVCMAIIAALVALSFPAVQSAREASRRSTCQQHLRELGLAVQQYEGARRSFPPGILGVAKAFHYEGNYHTADSPFCWRRFQYTSFLGVILPYLEEQASVAAVDAIMFDIQKNLDELRDPSGQPVYGSFLDVNSAIELAQREIAGFRCPADSLADPVGGELQYVFGALQPVLYGPRHEDRLAWINLVEYDARTFPHSNYAGCLGAHSGGVQSDETKRRFVGLMSSRARVSPRHCRDGLSQTVLAGETLGSVEAGQRTVVNSWFFGAVARGRGDVPWLVAPSHTKILGDATNAHVSGFASSHPDGVYFVYGDGHVDIVDRAVDWKAWYRSCGIADGNVPIPDETVVVSHGR